MFKHRVSSKLCLLALISLLILTLANSTRNFSKSAMLDSGVNDQLFTPELQAKWFSSLSNSLCNDMSASLNRGRNLFDPKGVVDSLKNILKEQYGEQETINQAFYDSLDDLKDDPDFSRIMTELDEALNGERNIMTIGNDLPELQEEESPAVQDVGLRGLVVTGEDTYENGNDLIRYSNYISGSGSTFGGFMAGLPQDIEDLTEGTLKSLSYKHDALEYKLKKGITVDVLKDENFQASVRNNVDTDLDMRAKRTGVKDLPDVVVSESFDSIKNLQGVGGDTKLTQQNFNSQKKVGNQRTKGSSKKLASKMLGRVGNGVETASTAFGLAQGGIDLSAGSEMIDRARELRNQGKHSEANALLRDGRLRVAQGSFGLASSMKNVATFVGKRVEKNVLKRVGQAGAELLQQTKRFGPVIGGAISIGTGITSMAKNAIAASDAAKQGNVGKAAMYSVMAAVDGVTVILDGISLALDFVFPPLSPIIDLVSTILQVVNTILGFFADLIDFRTTKQRVSEEFKAYIESDAFKAYVNNMADEYRQRGFDVFTYYVDAEAAGIKANKKTLRAEAKKMTTCLSTKATNDFNDKNLRVALVDATSLGKELRGRANDDEIVAGFGPDQVYGEEGDDILFGRGGDDTIYGGPGNDYLNGGTGRDILLGGKGDDIIDCEIAIDKRCEGQQGDDTLELNGNSLIYDEEAWRHKYITLGPDWEYETHPSLIEPTRGIYLDMKNRRNGINLGSCFPGWPGGFNEFIHKPAFYSANDNLDRKFVQLFNNKRPRVLENPNELTDKLLWFLADKDDVKYFCDGESFYAVSSTSIKVAKNAINTINLRSAQLKNGRLKYTEGNEVQALLVFAFRKSFRMDDFERVTTVKPGNLERVSNYIPTTVVGSDSNNVIDLPYGLGDFVYTGEGDNVVSIGCTWNYYQFTDLDAIGRTNMYFGFYKWAKYVIGGSGDNKLIIQYMNLDGDSLENRQYGVWTLRNFDEELGKGNSRSYNSHVVYLKNIQTVELRAPEHRRSSEANLNIDATEYDGATRYILDGPQFFHGPTAHNGKDVMVLPRRIHGTQIIRFGRYTKNTISFQFYEDEERKIEFISVEQPTNGYVRYMNKPYRGNVWIEHGKNIISSPSCKEITGSNYENLLMAVGGQTTVDAKDGDDTLVSVRGRHVLKGGQGLDTYVLHGPDVTDFVTISVIKGDDGNTITCRTTAYGNWNQATQQLEIDILQDDHEDVLLKNAQIVSSEGEDNAKLGTVTKDSSNRKLIYSPGSDFDSLKRNQAKVIRVQFTTTGSFATIFEEDDGNQLRFESIKSFDELTASIEDDKLVLSDKSDTPQKVVVDEQWSVKLKTEKITAISDLILDFAKRFPVIVFKINDQEYARAAVEDTIQFLYDHLKHIESELNKDYDTILDSATLSSKAGDEINVGNGQNIILAKTKGKTYKLGSESSGSIIIATEFTQGSGNVVLTGGEGSNSVNAVVLKAGSTGIADIRLGPHDVIITGATPEEVKFSRCGDSVCVQDSQNNKMIQGWNYQFNCQRLVFKKSDETQIIMNCRGYVDSQLNPDWGANTIKVTHGSSKDLNLHLPFKRKEAAIVLYYDSGEKALWIFFKKQNQPNDSWREPYLVVPSDERKPSQLDARMLVNAISFQFKAGIKFSDGLIGGDQICQFVIDTLNKHPTQEFELTGLDLQC